MWKPRIRAAAKRSSSACGIAPHALEDRFVAARTASDQLPVGIAEPETLLNVLLAFDPSVVIAAMQTTMIRASMTAYSTAVGPSSETRNRLMLGTSGNRN